MSNQYIKNNYIQLIFNNLIGIIFNALTLIGGFLFFKPQYVSVSNNQILDPFLINFISAYAFFFFYILFANLFFFIFMLISNKYKKLESVYDIIFSFMFLHIFMLFSYFYSFEIIFRYILSVLILSTLYVGILFLKR